MHSDGTSVRGCYGEARRILISYSGGPRASPLLPHSLPFAQYAFLPPAKRRCSLAPLQPRPQRFLLSLPERPQLLPRLLRGPGRPGRRSRRLPLPPPVPAGRVWCVAQAPAAPELSRAAGRCRLPGRLHGASGGAAALGGAGAALAGGRRRLRTGR